MTDHYFLSYFVRCYTCNNLLGDKEEDYQRLVDMGESIEETLNTLGIFRYCCRSVMMNPSKIYFNNQNRKAVDGDLSSLTPDPVDYSLEAKVLKERKYDPDIDKIDAFDPSDLPTKIGIPTIIQRPGFDTYVSLDDGKEYKYPPDNDNYVTKISGRAFVAI